MADLTKLSAELAKDEYADAIAAGDHASLSAILNAKTRTVRRMVPTDRLINAAMQTAKYAVIKMISAGQDIGAPVPLELRGACIILMDTFFQPKAFPEIDLDNPAVTMLLGGLIAGGLLTMPEKTGIMALGDALVSVAEAEGIVGTGGSVSIADIPEALLIMGESGNV